MIYPKSNSLLKPLAAKASTIEGTKLNKKKSANKIDPAVAFLMSFGTWQAEHEDFAFDMSENHKERLLTFNGI